MSLKEIEKGLDLSAALKHGTVVLNLSVVLALCVSLWLKCLKFKKNMPKLYHWKKG